MNLCTTVAVEVALVANPERLTVTNEPILLELDVCFIGAELDDRRGETLLINYLEEKGAPI